MIFYNGQTGSLGRYLKDAAPEAKPLEFRLDPSTSYDQHFQRLLKNTTSTQVTLIPLAGMVSVPACQNNPEQAHLINVTETLRLIESFIDTAVLLNKNPRVIYVSTGHVYAEAVAPKKLSESDLTHPRSVYANTKLLAESAITEAAQRRQTPLKILRVFGLLAPMQPSHYVLPSLIRRVKSKDLMSIPGLSFYRDYLDARDVCQSLVLVSKKMDTPSPLIFNLCSGHPVQIKNLVDEIARALHVPNTEYENILTEGQKRSDDVPWIVGDPSLFEKTFGAQTQRTPLTSTIQDAIQNTL
jgi:nucleoside-diphosphate-sugar epimerase